LWFVFLDLGLDECTSLILGVVESSFDLGPDSLQVSDDFNSLSLSTDEDFLGSLDHNFFESIDISLSFLQSSQDLWLQNLQFLVKEVLDFSGGFLYSALDLLPEVGESTFGDLVGFRLDKVLSDDDLDDFSVDLNDDFLGSLDDGFFHLVQLSDDQRFVLLDHVQNGLFDLSSEFLGGFLHFGPQIFDSISLGSG